MKSKVGGRVEPKSEQVGLISCALGSELSCCTTAGGTHSVLFSVKGILGAQF